MIISMYQASVPVFIHMLNNLVGILEKDDVARLQFVFGYGNTLAVLLARAARKHDAPFRIDALYQTRTVETRARRIAAPAIGHSAKGECRLRDALCAWAALAPSGRAIDGTAAAGRMRSRWMLCVRLVCYGFSSGFTCGSAGDGTIGVRFGGRRSRRRRLGHLSRSRCGRGSLIGANAENRGCCETKGEQYANSGKCGTIQTHHFLSI